MAKFILLLAVVCTFKDVSLKHHHRHSKNDYKAYSRSAVSTKEKTHGTEQEDYDHIIVVKNTKAITPEKPKPALSEKIVTKEPDFDHTIVVKTKAFQEDLPNSTSTDRVTPEKSATSSSPAKSVESITSSPAGGPIVVVRPAVPPKPVSFEMSELPVISGEPVTPPAATLTAPKAPAQNTILRSGATEKTAISKDKESPLKTGISHIFLHKINFLIDILRSQISTI